jgi:hypothetical protein
MKGAEMPSPLFNQAIKQRYIESSKPNESMLNLYFGKVATKEAEYGKDITEMHPDELIDSFRSMKLTRENYRRNMLSLFKGYFIWASENGYTTNENYLNRIQPADIVCDVTVSETMIGSPEHLRNILDEGLDYINLTNRSIATELQFKLLYLGIELKEIQALRKTNIEPETGMITTYTNYTLQVDDDIAGLWKRCCSMKFFEKINGLAKDAKKKDVSKFALSELFDNDYLFRTPRLATSHSDDMLTINMLSKRISAVFEAAGKPTVPAKNILLSGRFYRMRQAEQQGKRLTHEDILNLHRIDFEKNDELPRLTRYIRKDYKNWLEAFNY